MILHITDKLIFDTSLPLEEQQPQVQEYLNDIAFDYNGACTEHCVWQGDDTADNPIRYEKLVHDIATLEGAVIRTTVSWTYNFPYGHQAAFSGSYNLKLEVING